MQITYKTCQDAANAKKERNDCAVKAVAIATEVSYNTVHRVFANIGRRNGRGVSFVQLKRAIEQFTGSDVKYKTILKPNGSRFTGKTIGQALPKGRYILIFRGHTAALVDGVIEDWTEDRKTRVLGYFEV